MTVSKVASGEELALVWAVSRVSRAFFHGAVWVG